MTVVLIGITAALGLIALGIGLFIVNPRSQQSSRQR
jgi:hypothetical protein